MTATFQGDVFGDGFVTTNNNKPVLDGAPSGSAPLVYPLDHAVFPANLTPIYAQIQSSGGAIARLNFQGTGRERELLRQLRDRRCPAGAAPSRCRSR